LTLPPRKSTLKPNMRREEGIINVALVAILTLLATLGIIYSYSLKTSVGRGVVPEETETLEKQKFPEKSADPRLEELEWQIYESTELGLKFSYPTNLPSLCYTNSGNSLLTSGNTKFFKARASVCYRMAYIFDVQNLGKAEKDLDSIIAESNPDETRLQKIKFKNVDALFDEPLNVQQVPSYAYIFIRNEDLYKIVVMKTDSAEEAEIIDRVIESLEFK